MHDLIVAALDARRHAYVPYSHFSVGAALLDESQTIYTGCNIENAAYPVTCCAERVALFQAVSKGIRRFTALCVVGGPQGVSPTQSCPPCGLCRQALREFCDPETFTIVLATSPESYRTMTLDQLLPESFGPSHLNNG